MLLLSFGLPSLFRCSDGTVEVRVPPTFPLGDGTLILQSAEDDLSTVEARIPVTIGEEHEGKQWQPPEPSNGAATAHHVHRGVQALHSRATGGRGNTRKHPSNTDVGNLQYPRGLQS